MTPIACTPRLLSQRGREAEMGPNHRVSRWIVLGAAGMERIFEIELTADEQVAFDASAAAVRDLVGKLG